MLSSAGAVLVHVCKRQLTPNGQRGAQKNHLSGLKRRLLKVTFWNEHQLQEVKRDTLPLVRRNRSKSRSTAAYAAEALGERSTRDRVKVRRRRGHGRGGRARSRPREVLCPVPIVEPEGGALRVRVSLSSTAVHGTLLDA